MTTISPLTSIPAPTCRAGAGPPLSSGEGFAALVDLACIAPVTMSQGDTGAAGNAPDDAMEVQGTPDADIRDAADWMANLFPAEPGIEVPADGVARGDRAHVPSDSGADAVSGEDGLADVDWPVAAEKPPRADCPPMGSVPGAVLPQAPDTDIDTVGAVSADDGPAVFPIRALDRLPDTVSPPEQPVSAAAIAAPTAALPGLAVGTHLLPYSPRPMMFDPGSPGEHAGEAGLPAGNPKAPAGNGPHVLERHLVSENSSKAIVRNNTPSPRDTGAVMPAIQAGGAGSGVPPSHEPVKTAIGAAFSAGTNAAEGATPVQPSQPVIDLAIVRRSSPDIRYPQDNPSVVLVDQKRDVPVQVAHSDRAVAQMPDSRMAEDIEAESFPPADPKPFAGPADAAPTIAAQIEPRSARAAIRPEASPPSHAHHPTEGPDIEMRDGAAYLTLDGDELGRIDIRVERGEAGLAIVMRAERGESADLMRRNADVLHRELAESGIGNARLDFTQGGGAGNPAGSRRSARGGTGAPDTRNAAPPENARHAPTATDRVDLRL